MFLCRITLGCAVVIALAVATPTEVPEPDMPTVEQEVDMEDEPKVDVALLETSAPNWMQSSGATYRVHTVLGFLNIHSETGDPFRADNVVGKWHDGDTFEAIGDMVGTVQGPWVQSERGWSIAKYNGFEFLERIKEKEATLPLLQALVDDVDAKVLGSTLEPVLQCPVTAGRTFHHDGLQKGRRAHATFNFDPPHDGCYLVEEMHPQLDQCRASSNTKVHVNYCQGLQASGTLDQTANAGQWTFVAALPFYAGHKGNVTLSNEGTEPGTLAVFDKVRFTWSGKSCRTIDSHPRQAEIRMTVDFQHIANRHSEFGSALKAKLAALASVPEKSLRLTGLRPGSIIAQFLVLPSVVDGPLATGLSAGQIVERLRGAVAKSAAELCTLTGGPVEGCNVEFKDHGIATPSIRPVAKQQTQQQQQLKEEEKEEEGSHTTIIALCASVGLLSIFILMGFIITRLRKANREVPASINEAKSTEVTASMEEGKVEGKVVEDQKAEDASDTHSTDCPSSDKQSEPSVSGDVDAMADENGSNPDLGVISALTSQSI